MSRNDDKFILGDYNAACYECGRKRKASRLMKHWRGYFVCPEHWEPRQPQDFVGNVPPTEAPEWTQPQTDGTAPGAPPTPPIPDYSKL